MQRRKLLLGAGKMSVATQKTTMLMNPDEMEMKRRDLIKRTICKGATDDELELFIHACKHTGLDPFMKQIHAVKRKSKNGDVMTIQTGIDGLRLIADRSGNYAPGREPTFQYDTNGRVKSATSFIKKRTGDGVWHEVSATAFYSEYKPTYTNDFWENKAHIMLSKCAEALALRKAFPAEMSGLYTAEEMEQADNEIPGEGPKGSKVDPVTEDVDGLIESLFHKVKVPAPQHFESYLKFVQSKLQGRTIGQVLAGWLKDPEPFLNHYKSWLEKNKLNVIQEIEDAEVEEAF
jgi:phage recombination protein Bet